MALLHQIFNTIFRNEKRSICTQIFRGRPDIMTLESQSHNFGYSRQDIDGQIPENGKCIQNCPDTLSTNLDLPSLKSVLER